MEREESVLQRTKKRREQYAKADPRQYGPITHDTRALILALLTAGATMTEVSETEGMPGVVHIWTERQKDAAFDADVTAAMARGAASLLSAVQEFALEMAATNDPDQMRVAHMSMQIASIYAEKMAPREFGALVKLAGADGGPLTVGVVNYAELHKQKLETIEAEDGDEVRQIEHSAPKVVREDGE